MNFIHYDSSTQRQIKNSRVIKPELNGAGLIDVGRVTGFIGERGAETLILEGGYAGVIINVLDPKYQGLLETAVLVQMEHGLERHINIILIGSGSALEQQVMDYGIQVINAPDGYLQQHHLPQLRQALQNITQRR